MPHAHAKLALGLAMFAVMAGCQQVQQQDVSSKPPLPELRPNLRVEVSRAQHALADGRLGAARDGFAAALRTSPNDVAAGLGLAETYMALSDFTTASRVFEATARHAVGRDRARISQGLGLIALNAEDLATARRQLRAAVDSDDALWRAWVGLGRIHARAGEANSARVAFAQAEAAAPSLGQVMNDIGMSYMMERQPRQAVPYFERALVADGRLEMARGNLRIARAMAGEYDLAIAGAPVDELADALNNVGYIAVVNGDFEVADQYLRRALEVSPSYHQAAAANLNLLAHAQASGTRPHAQAKLAGSVPVPAATPAPEPSSTRSRVADAATRTGPLPPTTGNIGLHVDSAQNGIAQATLSARASPVPSPSPSTNVAILPAAEPLKSVSDVQDAADFKWTDTPHTMPSETSRDAIDQGAEKSAEMDLATSDVEEAEQFQWEQPNEIAFASKPEATGNALPARTEINMRDDGFLWMREVSD